MHFKDSESGWLVCFVFDVASKNIYQDYLIQYVVPITTYPKSGVCLYTPER